MKTSIDRFTMKQYWFRFFYIKLNWDKWYNCILSGYSEDEAEAVAKIIAVATKWEYQSFGKIDNCPDEPNTRKE